MASLMDAIVIKGSHCEVDMARVIAMMKQDGTYDPNKSYDTLVDEITVAVKSSGFLMGTGKQVDSFRFYGVKVDPKDRKPLPGPKVDTK